MFCRVQRNISLLVNPMTVARWKCYYSQYSSPSIWKVFNTSCSLNSVYTVITTRPNTYILLRISILLFPLGAQIVLNIRITIFTKLTTVKSSYQLYLWAVMNKKNTLFLYVKTLTSNFYFVSLSNANHYAIITTSGWMDKVKL